MTADEFKFKEMKYNCLSDEELLLKASISTDEDEKQLIIDIISARILATAIMDDMNI